LSRLIRRVTNAAATPWATRVDDHSRMSAAACASARVELAAPIASPMPRSDCRCRTKRSRSVTTPASTPSRRTGTWRIVRSAIRSIASAMVARASSASTGAVMTVEIGASSDTPGSATRPITSCRVKMPRASSTITEPTRSCSIRSNTARSGMSAGTDTGARRSRSPSGVASERQCVACCA
jgi:hypothetical protein